MNFIVRNTVLFGLIFTTIGCHSQINTKTQSKNELNTLNQLKETQILTGADQPDLYLDKLKNKKVGILTNQTGIYNSTNLIQSVHLVDFLISQKINIQKIYAPEHGFRGTADAGELIKDGKDTATGLPIISLYGNNKKPTAKQLEGIDIMVFDLQDVGARFYTYISSLHYLMEACAEHNIPVIVLDRPNPNGHIIDGPILETDNKSFVGMHPIPIMHGMTIGEYALMINGEGWLANNLSCKLEVIPCADYNKKKSYHLPIAPSPNLPNARAINLYASLCFFEGTNVSVGRGTSNQFQVYGSPFLKNMPYQFTPKPNLGAKDPMHNNKVCFGEDLTQHPKLNEINLEWLIKAYNNTDDKSKFFNNFFIKLAGTSILQKQIEQGLTAKEIKATWQNDIEKFKKTRSKYLIYRD